MMRPYVVRQGDYLAKLAWVHGFDADAVWNDPRNAELKALRRDHHVLAPGDVIYLPPKKQQALSIRKGETNKYVAEVPKVEINLLFRAPDGTVFAKEPCEVRGLDGSATETDDTGKLSMAVPVTVREIAVHFPRRNVTYDVRVGDMDPDQETSGLRKRLEHLGFWHFHGEPGISAEGALSAAIRRFQESAGLAVTGAPDDATREALGLAHGA